MNNDQKRQLDDCANELVKIREWINKNQLHSNIKFLVAYAVIKSSGTIEIVFKSILNSFLSEKCKEETAKFIEKNVVDNSCNPSTGRMSEFLGQFDTKRKDDFDSKTKGIEEKNDLNSLVSLRNDIAHGRDIHVSIDTVKKYFESGRKIVEMLDGLL